MTSRSSKGWPGVNRIRQETGTRYINSEVIQLVVLVVGGGGGKKSANKCTSTKK